MKRVVINGATGAIGIALVNKLVKEGVEVLVLCHKNSPRNKYIPQTDLVSVIECDMAELKYLELNDKYDVFFSFAWENGYLRDDVYAQVTNIQYELEALELAKKIGCRKFVGAGSQAEYGIKNELIDERVASNPVTAFGMTKMYVGMLSELRAKQLNIEFVWARIFSVYGPYDGAKTMLSSLISNMIDDLPVKLTECRQLWDYLYCDDAAEAMYLIATKGKNGQIYNIGSGKVRTLKEYVEIVRNCIDTKSIIEYGAVPYSDNQIMMLGADISKLKKDTGFEPKIRFEEGILEMINWVQNKKCF